MRVLIYNWAPYDQEHGLGGGVALYCRNLVRALRAKQVEVHFLYSGIDYSWRSRGPFYRKVKNRTGTEVPLFSIFNSPVVAPAYLSFDRPSRDVSSPELEACFRRFLEENGPYDAVHFHNLEGVTAGCLGVAKKLGVRTVFSLHNYWSVCSQVNLWHRSETQCVDFRNGEACVTCQTGRGRVRSMILAGRRVESVLRVSGLARSTDLVEKLRRLLHAVFAFQPWLGKFIRFHWLRKSPVVPREVVADSAREYRERRKRIVGILNEEADVIVAVSDTVAGIYRDFGVRPDRLRRCYIGTKAKEFVPPSGNPVPFKPGSPFGIAFLGPLRAEKGINFLLDELEALPASELKSMSLLVAGKILVNFEVEERLHALSRRLHSLRYQSGYGFEEIPALLRGTHLGIVAPLWQDNLPQVTFEMMACGVPVLCSIRGGAKEFVRHPAFVFDPGREGEFRRKLLAVRDTPSLLSEFWTAARPLKSMNEHADELLHLYRDLPFEGSLEGDLSPLEPLGLKAR